MRLPLLALVFLFAWRGSEANADGCKYSITGHRVPEYEQRAFIEWADGIETLHVAVRSEPTNQGSVWIVPICAAGADVHAEPVDEFPAVTFYITLRDRAKIALANWIEVAGMLDSFGLCCPFYFSGCSGSTTGVPQEISRIEKMGMTVTVVSAATRSELDSYLNSQGFNRVAADLSSLEPYFGKAGYAFVCGWVTQRGKPASATGMKIIFPSKSFWFPLLATRANHAPVETVVYVRDFVKPADGCDLPKLSCEYVFGNVELKHVGDEGSADSWSTERDAQSDVRLTRVTLSTDTDQWDRDLELVPGTSSVGAVSLLVLSNWLHWLPFVFSALIGALLGLIIPWAVIARKDRDRRDWIFGAAIGGAIVASILASVVVFALWRFQTSRKQPNNFGRWSVIPALAIAHYSVVFVTCKSLMLLI